MDFILDHGLLGVAKGQHAHGLVGQLHDLGIQDLGVQILDLSVQAQVLLRRGQQALRGTLIQRLAHVSQIDLAELIGGVEALHLDGLSGHGERLRDVGT